MYQEKGPSIQVQKHLSQPWIDLLSILAILFALEQEEPPSLSKGLC